MQFFEISKNLVSYDQFLDPDMNEKEFTMCFMYPVFNDLIKHSKNEIVVRCEAFVQKKEEHTALDDHHRRSPGPSIDFIFKHSKHKNIEFALGEVSYAPFAQSQEHCIGDRNKITKNLETVRDTCHYATEDAKNLKAMLKYIISLKPELNENNANKIKVYRVYVYQFKARV